MRTKSMQNIESEARGKHSCTAACQLLSAWTVFSYKIIEWFCLKRDVNERERESIYVNNISDGIQYCSSVDVVRCFHQLQCKIIVDYWSRVIKLRQCYCTDCWRTWIVCCMTATVMYRGLALILYGLYYAAVYK